MDPREAKERNFGPPEEEIRGIAKLAEEGRLKPERGLVPIPKGLKTAIWVAAGLGTTVGTTGCTGPLMGLVERLIHPPVEPASAAQIPPRPEITESRVVFREDFENPTLPGWSVRPGETGRVTVENSWLRLEAPFGSTYPVVERKDIFPVEGDFELNAKLNFPEKEGYGAYFWLLDENDKPILSVNGGECANRFIRAALNNGKEVNPFIIFSNENYNNGWDGPLGNADIPHQVSFYYDSEKKTGHLALDETYVLELSDLPRPVGVRMGNPVTTTDSGAWTTMGVEFLEVRQSLESSFIIPKEPSPYELALFKEIDGQEIKEISTFGLPPGDNWAIEVEATFSNFSADKPAWIQIGELKIVGGKGWEAFVIPSAGKEGERFGFVIYRDVGRREEGKDSLRRPKEPHTFRLVALEGEVYLYVDGILVGQGPGEKITGKIPVGILEEGDGTKVDIESMKLFSVSP